MIGMLGEIKIFVVLMKCDKVRVREAVETDDRCCTRGGG